MAKDNIGLLNEIAASLKKMNNSQIRRDIADQVYRDRELAANATGVAAQPAGPAFIDDATDFKRRVKGSISATIIAEKFTDSGKRAKDSVKKIKEEKKYKKLAGLKMKDKRVGLSTVVAAVKAGPEGAAKVDTGLQEIKLMKVNTDALVQMLGGIRKHLGMSNKATEKARKKKIDAIKNAARAAAEAAREKKKESQDKAKKGGKVDVSSLKKPSARGAGFAALFLRIAAIPLLLVGWAVAGVTAVVSDFMTGYDQNGLAGGIGKALGGSGKGIWNAIKQSFKVGGVGAMIGGAIGFLFGGIGAIPGAIIGGLIGMAIGAVFGYFGGDKITAGLKSATKAIGTAWDEGTGYILFLARKLGAWFYTPGQKGNVAGPHGDTKAKILGGFISWEPGKFSISGAWNQAKQKVKDLFKSIGNAIYNPTTETFFGGTKFEFAAPDWFVGVTDAVGKVWTAIKDFAGMIKNTVIGLLPDWLTDKLGMTVDGVLPGSNGSIGENNVTIMSKAKAMELHRQQIMNPTADGPMMFNGMPIHYFKKTSKQMALEADLKKNKSVYSGMNHKDSLRMLGLQKAIDEKPAIVPATDSEAIIQKMVTSDSYLADGYAAASGANQGTVNVNTDNSQNTGAVVVQHIYTTGMGSGGEVQIHDVFDAFQASYKDYGMGAKY